jgi:hypothetical protein
VREPPELGDVDVAGPGPDPCCLPPTTASRPSAPRRPWMYERRFSPAERGAASPHRASANSLVDTISPARRQRTASNSRCFGGPGTGRVWPSVITSGPRTPNFTSGHLTHDGSLVATTSPDFTASPQDGARCRVGCPVGERTSLRDLSSTLRKANVVWDWSATLRAVSYRPPYRRAYRTWNTVGRVPSRGVPAIGTRRSVRRWTARADHAAAGTPRACDPAAPVRSTGVGRPHCRVDLGA